MIKIYTLSDPRNNDIRYIGQTEKKLSARLSCHVAPSALVFSNHRTNWINSLIKENILPQITLIDEVEDHLADISEINWIKYYKDLGCELTNATDGGGGMRNPSLETRKKLSEASKGKNNANYGVKRTKEINDKINQTRIMKHSDETKKRIGEMGKGRKHSDESKSHVG